MEVKFSRRKLDEKDPGGVLKNSINPYFKEKEKLFVYESFIFLTKLCLVKSGKTFYRFLYFIFIKII